MRGWTGWRSPHGPECKVSNSKVNSHKRLNHEAVDKVAKWEDAFGRQCVPGAVLQGALG